MMGFLKVIYLMVKVFLPKENGDVINGIWKDGELFEEIESKEIKNINNGD